MATILSSREADLAAITRIYAAEVLGGTSSFETEAPSEADMAARRREVLARGLPWLVAEQAGEVVGYAYCNAFKPRPAYRFSAEISIYLAPQAQRQGLGRALMAELVARAEAAGLRRLIALIGGADNHASLALHRATGFTEAGVMRSCGWKFGRWLDVVVMEKALGDGDRSPPE